VSDDRDLDDILLVGTDWLAARLGDSDLRIIEVTPPGSGYVFAHLPGAVYLSLDDVFADRSSGINRTTGTLARCGNNLGAPRSS